MDALPTEIWRCILAYTVESSLADTGSLSPIFAISLVCTRFNALLLHDDDLYQRLAIAKWGEDGEELWEAYKGPRDYTRYPALGVSGKEVFRLCMEQQHMLRSTSQRRLFVWITPSGRDGVVLHRGAGGRLWQMWKCSVSEEGAMTFKRGQWLHGRVYPRDCALSPSGELFGCHIRKVRGGTEQDGRDLTH